MPSPGSRTGDTIDDHHPTRNAAFNALLHRLHETVSQLAQQYQKDVDAALHENEELSITLIDIDAGNIADGQDGGEEPPPKSPLEASDLTDLTEANDSVPKEGKSYTKTASFDDATAPEIAMASSMARKDSDLYAHMEGCVERRITRRITRQTTHNRQFRMRSPWADQHDFDVVRLSDIMPTEMFRLCLDPDGKRRHGSETDELENDAQVQIGNLRLSLLHPESMVRGWWVVACMLLLLSDLIMIPINVSFDLEETSLSRVMDVTASIFWTVDIVFTFFVGVRLSHSLEMRPSKVACLYFKSWFIFDMFLIIPEWVTMAITEDSFSGGQVSVLRMARWGRLMRLLRMARILRLGRLRPLMRHLIYVFNLSKVYIQLIQALAGLTLALLAFVHIISCLWYAIGNSADDGWVSVNGLKSASVGQAYSVSLHWTFSRLHGIQTYNEMESVNEVVLDALLICVSLMLAAYYNGTVAAVAIARCNAQSFNLWRVSILFVMKYQISPSLDNKMTRFLECSKAGGVNETAAEEHTLLESLPKTLQRDLLFEARAPFLSSKPFLHDLLLVNPRVIYHICVEATAQKIYVDGELVFASGDACHGMVFIESGAMYYILDDPSGESLKKLQEKLFSPMSIGPPRVADSLARRLEAPSSLSEQVLWTHWTHNGSLLTVEESVSLVLSPVGFGRVVAEHHEILCYAYKYAKQFLSHLNHASVHDDLTAFHQITIEDLDQNMHRGTEYDHFMFLSHYKVEAGTEATLMRDLFWEILRGDADHSANELRSPIFIDSEDLTDLSKLKEHVIGSSALVLLLTPGVLSRPWCLVEIVTAVDHEVNIVPVEIQRPGFKYNYPDERFYSNILQGKFLNQSSVDLLKNEGISLSDVEQAIRKVFLKIALPFSPHKTKAVREAESHDILTRSSHG